MALFFSEATHPFASRANLADIREIYCDFDGTALNFPR